MECDKNSIIKRASIPARDLRIIGPIFSHSSSILEVLLFIDQLRHQLPQKSVVQDEDLQFPNAGEWLQVPQVVEGLQEELERDGYPVLDELAMSVSTGNL
ncbi:magnesium transporter MRS2-4-like [Ipomoea triloba]|uniref:magnesium transporter MRS2-4-like n=1 Tax=Ipomoea triloba TaxID=35885 RepID=UPI00125E1945|nr:magnesium transporter MRS2-4-like [Ipomoea triloba]